MYIFPLKKKHVYLTVDSHSFENIDYHFETEIPIGNTHPGTFGFVRKNHTHEGVDLYCLPNDPVVSVEDGEIVLIEWFTGENAGSPWWHNTRAVHVEGDSGVIVYGEVIEKSNLKVGDSIKQGETIGYVTPVLKKDKGRPMTMLHFELYKTGNRESVIWLPHDKKPEALKNPTNLLIESAILHFKK